MRWLLIIWMLFLCCDSSAQKKTSVTLPYQSKISSPKKSAVSHRKDVVELFKLIEKEIRNNSINGFRSSLGNTVYVTVLTSESDYFSKNQAEAILSNFFSQRKYVSFSFSRISDQTTVPYATGRYVYAARGNQETCQIYVSLSLQESRWVITQFNIY